MRLVATLTLLTALGCSSSDFEVAAPVDSGTNSDSGAADSHAQLDVAGPDTEPPPEPFDASGPACSSIDECAPGHYCRRPACDAKVGVCVPYTTTPGYQPVCGCDGVTYWNKSYAWTTDATIRHDGRCTNVEAAKCLGTTCDSLPDSICVRELASAAACVATLEMGVCWRLPYDHSCGSTPGSTVSTCDGKCTSYCSGVRNKQPFYHKTCTP